MERKLKIGISSCLLGNNVRYNGGHQLDKFLRDVFGNFVEWVAVCPEVECGLSIPREAMRLTGDIDHPRLVTSRSNTDYTDRMLSWSEKKLEQLRSERLCGFVFKSKSPSSALYNAKLYDENGMPNRKRAGIFAGEFMKCFPYLPVEDEGRLNDADLKENFIERVFVVDRWHELCEAPTVDALVRFHTRHKYLIMAHDPTCLKKLGKMVSEAKPAGMGNVLGDYFRELMDGLKQIATVKKNTNVLQHIMGYFKKDLSGDEKQELVEIIERYHAGLIPLIAPVILLQHYVRKFEEPYLKDQYYLHPHPLELMLRNHV